MQQTVGLAIERILRRSHYLPKPSTNRPTPELPAPGPTLNAFDSTQHFSQSRPSKVVLPQPHSTAGEAIMDYLTILHLPQ